METVQKPSLLRMAYSVREVTDVLSLSRTSIYQLIRSGHLRATKCGRRTIILATDITAFLASLQEGCRR